MSLSPDDYPRTSSVCYTDKATADKCGSVINYLGSYTDYCVKLKYLEIFFKGATTKQLKHNFCDCYFVKFICTYGLGILKRAFCSTDDILYFWNQHKDIPEYKKNESMDLKSSLENNLDLYMAQYSKPIAKNWIKFCYIYMDNKISNNDITPDVKEFIVKLYLDKYQNHIFHDKYLPIYNNNDCDNILKS